MGFLNLLMNVCPKCGPRKSMSAEELSQVGSWKRANKPDSIDVRKEGFECASCGHVIYCWPEESPSNVI